MEGGTGVYYQAMPAVGPDGKNVMKLIPVQKVNGQFYQTPFSTERVSVGLQLKACAKPVHPPTASSSQTQTRLPSLQPIADGRYVLKTLPQVRTVSNAVKTQHSGTSNLIIHNPKLVHVPLSTHTVSQYSVQLPPQPNGQVMAAVQTLPVTVKSPVLPNGHFLQIPPNAKVRTLPATALPQSIKCRIMNSVSNTPNLEKGPPTVVLVSPVNSVKLNSDQQVVSVTKPSQIEKTLFQNPPANLQTPVCVPKTNEEVNTPIKWVVQEGTGAFAPCLVPVTTSNVSSDTIKAVKHVNSVGTVNEIAPSKPTPPQTSQEKITPGKDNALVMCNGKVYFVAKRNSEIAKDVMISEGGKRGVVSTSPALPASSALGSNSPKQDPKINVSEIIDLCDDEEETSMCLGGAPGNLPTPSQTEVDESDEDSNVIFVSYIPPKSETHAGDKVEKAASQNKCEEVQHTEINAKSVSQNEGEKLAHAEMEKDGGPNNPSAKTGDEMMDEQVEGNKRAERTLCCLSENVNMEADKDLEGGSPPEMRCQDDAAVAETVSILEPPQNVCIQATDNTEKAFEKSQPKSDCQLRKEFGIASDVQICLQRTKLTVKPDQLTKRLIINKRTLDGLRKVIQESKLQSKIQQIMKVPYTKMEEDEGLKVKRKKQEQDGSQDIPSLNSTHISPASKSSVVPMENSLACQEEVCSPTESTADKVHMQSELPEDCTGNTCCLTPSSKQKAKQTSSSHPLLPSSSRKTPPRSIKVKVCTACPCGTVLGAAEATSSLHSQDRLNPCTVVESHKGTRRSCLNKTPGESHQSQKLQPQNKDLVKKVGKKRSSGNPRKNKALLESSTSDTSHNISSPVIVCSSAPSSSSLQDCNNQIELSSVRTECGNMTSSNTDAETSQQDTSQVQTASENPSMSFSKKQQGHKIDIFPTQSLFTLETLDAEEIKRRERIKRLKDLLKEKEAALEQMQRSMNI
ncbi:ligand-dependent nuclear receptor-interacting factor 1-like [Sinocyclocheilus anshuiensis]|uniref:Ligand-dependent nuclear receptor-interacting factor 1-like n=1 Tax=Sinocyclocheilus anshuiensis TaxID=1608454 RepID=A0A671K607_9TELE|nr:PREDICTED: ligand-dependent nuclear receptor-interacting factor 1-like [Sinocyclocheilus anshuiensis]